MFDVRRSMKRILVAALALGGLAATTLAGGIDDFKLTRAIPADVFVAVHGRSHDGQKFLEEQMQRVWKAVEDAHLERDIKKLMRSMAEEAGQAEEFDQQWQQINDLIFAVDWCSLAKRESAFAMRLDFPVPQFVVLLVSEDGKAKDNFNGLAGMLEALSKLEPDKLVLTKDEQGETVIHKLSVPELPVPVAFTLARSKDVILVGLGASLPEQVLGMLGGGPGTTLASTPRFKEAFAKLPTPTDELAFVDFAALMSQIRNVVKQGMAMAEGPGGAQGGQGGMDPLGGMDPQIKALPGKMLDLIDIWEYIAAVGATDGKRTTQTALMVLRDNAKSAPLYQVFFGNPPLDKPLRFVPQEAGDVSVNTGVNCSALYKVITDFVKENVPDGATNLAQFEEAAQTQAGLNVEKDILGWIKGEITYFSVPGKTPYSPGDTAVLISVNDEAKAREMLGRAFDALTPILAQQNGSISDAEVAGGEGFKSILHPFLQMMPIGRPTLGVAQGHVILGTSPKVIEKALAVAAGSAPSFAENERFKKEGAKLEGKMIGVSFSDMSKFGEQMGQILQMAPMIMAMVPAQEMPPQMGAIMGMVSKIGPVLQKLDFLLSTSSVSTMDGPRITSTTVTNYQDPPKPATPNAGGGAEE